MTVFSEKIGDRFGGAYMLGSAQLHIDTAVRRCLLRGEHGIAKFADPERNLDPAGRGIPNNGKLKNACFGVTASSEFNAFSWISDDEIVTGIHVGAIVHIARVFDTLMCFPSVYPQIGMREKTPPFQNLDFCEHEIVNYISGKNVWLRPIDLDRLVFSRHLRDIALDFLTFHEIGHGAHGHNDLDAALWGGPARPRFELGAMGVELGGLDSQTLEMDADSVGALNALVYARFQRWPINCSDPTCYERPWYQDDAFAAQAFAVAIHAVFKMMNDSPPSAADLLFERTHPPATIRSTMVAATGAARAALEGWATEKEFSEWAVNGLVYCEAAHFKATGKGREGALEAFSDEATRVRIAVADAILTNWHKVRPQLVPYVRAGGLAPVQGPAPG